METARRFRCCASVGAVVVALSLARPAGAVEINGDTTWSGTQEIADTVTVVKGTLRIKPGATIHFSAKGKLVVKEGASLIAQGTAEKPVAFEADHAGQIEVAAGSLLLEQCTLRGIGPEAARQPFLHINAGDQSVIVRQCQLHQCGDIAIEGKGAVQIIGCDLREPRGGISFTGAGKLDVLDNTISGASIEIRTCRQPVIVRNNVLVGGTIICQGAHPATPSDLLIEGNYVHQPTAHGNYCLLGASGISRDNVLRGATWVSAQMGGVIGGNVFEAIPAAEFKKLGSLDEHGTHEHICGLQAGAVVERNLFLLASYGGIMGLGDYTASGALIRNNTFDRGGNPVYLNHLPHKNPSGIIIRNNLFMRGGPILDEKGVPDSIVSADYNCWCPVSAKGRFSNITRGGKDAIAAGFGAHDLGIDGRAKLAPKDVVAEPDFEFPWTDEEMLARKHTVEQCLALYRSAYTPLATSPVINHGDPVDKKDPKVTDGQPDIGAIEAAAVK